MAAIKTADDLKKLGTILSVWAHPDDETWCAAGIMAAAAANGQRVVCLVATKGEAGIQDEERWPANKLGDIRTKELAVGLEALGIKDYHVLDYYDGSCNKVPLEEGYNTVKAFIDTHMPDTILTFGPDGITGHPDHRTINHWVEKAVKGTGISVYHVVEDRETYEKYMKQLDKKFNFYFNIDKPPVRESSDCDICFDLSEELCQKKCAALKAMPSQTEAMFKNSPEGFLESAVACECYVRAKSVWEE